MMIDDDRQWHGSDDHQDGARQPQDLLLPLHIAVVAPVQISRPILSGLMMLSTTI